MRLIKQSTAYNLMVLMIDSSDHITGKTGLTLTITAAKNGGTFGSITPTVTELSYGWYKIELSTSHTDTLGDLAIHLSGTGADPQDVAIQVRAATTDDLVRSTVPANPLDVSATGEAGLDFNNVKAATGATTLTNITVPVVTSVTNDIGITQTGADKVWGSATRNLTSFGTLVNDVASAVWAVGTRTLTSFGTLVSDIWANSTRSLTDKVDFALSVTNRAALVDEVWDELISGHAVSGSTGEKLSTASLSGTPSIVLPVSVAQRAATGKVEFKPYLTYRFSFASTYAGDLSAATKLWYAVKERDVEDANGLILVEKTAGLSIVNRTAYGTSANGSISVTGSAGDWTISIFVDEAATAELGEYDGLACMSSVKALIAGEVVELRDDDCVIRLATIRTIS